MSVAGSRRRTARRRSPPTSDVDTLSDAQGVLEFHAEIAHGAVDLRVTEQKLHGPKVPGLPVDQRRLGPAQGVGDWFL